MTMRVTAETVAHVARLARLSLRDDEIDVFARQLDQVLAYAESIQSLDLEGVPPMSHAQAAAAWRDDVVVACLERDTALSQAPDAEAGFFRVPRIIG
jgi:aspartyl-tRNA(Asn)/glutamyl-tRNA(Gln) amidotransferase subunit C